MSSHKGFVQEDFLCLQTLRDNGEKIATVVWSVELDGKIWIRTAKSTGKIRRIRKNSEIFAAACEGDGTLLSQEEPFVGVLSTDSSIGTRVDELLRLKYGALADSTFTKADSEKIYIRLDHFYPGASR